MMGLGNSQATTVLFLKRNGKLISCFIIKCANAKLPPLPNWSLLQDELQFYSHLAKGVEEIEGRTGRGLQRSREMC